MDCERFDMHMTGGVNNDTERVCNLHRTQSLVGDQKNKNLSYDYNFFTIVIYIEKNYQLKI